jgi:hypothetical protein
VLIQQEIAGLCKAVEIATEVKGQKRKYIQTAETLTVGVSDVWLVFRMMKIDDCVVFFWFYVRS